MITITADEAEEGNSVEELSLTHEDCFGEDIESRSIRATIGESFDSSEVEEFVELECKSCGKKIWLQKRTGDTAKFLRMVIENRRGEVPVYEGKIKKLEYRNFNNLIVERTQVRVGCEEDQPGPLIENLSSGGEVSMEKVAPTVESIKSLVNSLYDRGNDFWGDVEKAEITGMSSKASNEQMVNVEVIIKLRTGVRKEMKVKIDTSKEEPEVVSFEVNPK